MLAKLRQSTIWTGFVDYGLNMTKGKYVGWVEKVNENISIVILIAMPTRLIGKILR